MSEQEVAANSGHVCQCGHYVPSKSEIREFIREEVEYTLHSGLVDTRQYRHVDITDADGKRWRGMVYAVEPVEESDKS